MKSGPHPAGRRPVVWHPASWLVLMLLLAIARPSLADIVETLDQGNLGGAVTLKPGDTALTLTDEAGNTQSVGLVDIDRVRRAQRLRSVAGLP